MKSFYHRRLRKYRGYHFGVLLCAITAAVVAVINLIFVIWAVAYSGVQSDLGTLQDGDCGRTSRLTFWTHLAINILSTMLLGASIYTMQCLSSPTRGEVDRAHSRGVWLDIGVPSFRNLRNLSSSRIALWWMLAVSSIPLHLLYNSAVFSTLCTRKYDSYVLSSDFVNGAPFNLTTAYLATYAIGSSTVDESFESALGQLETYQKDPNMLIRLDNQQCIKVYSNSINSANADLLLMTSTANSTNSAILYQPDVESTLAVRSASWICQVDPGDATGCDNGYQPNATNWTLHITGDGITVQVQYCLSQPVQEHCRLQFSLAIMIIVILCNVIKAVCMGLVVWRKGPEPLVTLGDAISSFIERPDMTTKNHCIDDKGRFMRDSTWDPTISKWEPKSRNWFRAASPRRWIICNAL